MSLKIQLICWEHFLRNEKSDFPKMLVCAWYVVVLWYSRTTFDGKIFTLTITTISMRFRLLKSLKSLWILCDSMWNSEWSYFGTYGESSHHRAPELLWKAQRYETAITASLFCLRSEKYLHSEFHIESHRIQSEIANTSVGCHTRRVSTPQSTWTCLGSIKIRNNYHENTISQRYLHSEFHIESHRIQSEMKWIRMAHTVSLHITDHLKLFGKHQYPKQLPSEYFLAGNQIDIITLNFT